MGDVPADRQSLCKSVDVGYHPIAGLRRDETVRNKTMVSYAKAKRSILPVFYRAAEVAAEK